MTVLDYFRTHYPDHAFAQPRDAGDLQSMPLDSNCGETCKEAIDASLAFRAHVRAAYGETHKGYDKALADMLVEVLGVYICG